MNEGIEMASYIVKMIVMKSTEVLNPRRSVHGYRLYIREDSNFKLSTFISTDPKGMVFIY